MSAAPYDTTKQKPTGARPMTSSGPGGRTQNNFYQPQLSSKPQPLMNAFSAGSNADLTEQKIEINHPVMISGYTN